ncbi:MAG: hypothetical protein ABFD79_07135 [Phycisphaerales bacterium]
MEKIKQIARQNPYGFTYNLRKDNFVRYGYVVAYLETQDCFDDDGLEKALKHSLEHDGIIGGWLNDDNDKYYYDSCKVFFTLADAIVFAKQNKQIALFDLTNQREIRV